MLSPNTTRSASKSVHDQRKEKESCKESHAEDDLADGTSPDKSQHNLSKFVTADNEGATAKFEKDRFLMSDVCNTEISQKSNEDWAQIYEKKIETTAQPMNADNLEEREPICPLTCVDTDDGSFYDSKSKQIGPEIIPMKRSPKALASVLPGSKEVETGQSANQGTDNPEEESDTEQSANQGTDNPEEESDTAQSANQGTDNPEEESDTEQSANQGTDNPEEESDTEQSANQGTDNPEEESDTGHSAYQLLHVSSPVEESGCEVGQLVINGHVGMHETSLSLNQDIDSPEVEYSLLKDANTIAADNEITVKYKKKIAEQSCREMGYTDEQIRLAKQEYKKDRDPGDCYTGRDLAEIIEKKDEETQGGSYQTVATVRDSGHPSCDGSSHKIEVEVPLLRCDCCDKQVISCKFVCS